MPSTTNPVSKELDEVIAKLHVLDQSIEELETERDRLIQAKRVLEQQGYDCSHELETFHNHLMGDPSLATLLFLHLHKLQFQDEELELEELENPDSLVAHIGPAIDVSVLLAYDFLMTWYTTETISGPAQDMAVHIEFFEEFKAVTESYYKLLEKMKGAELINFKYNVVWILPKGTHLIASLINRNLVQGADKKAKIVLSTFLQEELVT